MVCLSDKMVFLNAFKTVSKASNGISAMTTKLRGGRLSKIGEYFQNIFNDYRTVALETVSDIRERPIKATVYITSLGVACYLLKTNPSEESFYETVIENQNNLATVGDTIRNPYSNAHIETLRTSINEGVLRRISFGVCSFMWVDKFDPSVDLFVAQCKPLKVGWLEWTGRIIDFGILNRWWWMDDAMKDYDVNPDEWKDAFSNEKLS